VCVATRSGPLSAVGGLCLAVTACAACTRAASASAAQCERLVDRYVDLALSEDARAPRLTTEERARFRGALGLELLARPDVRRVKSRCVEEVTEVSYRCAIAAPTTSAWSACVARIE